MGNKETRNHFNLLTAEEIKTLEWSSTVHPSGMRLVFVNNGPDAENRWQVRYLGTNHEVITTEFKTSDDLTAFMVGIFGEWE